MSEITFTTEQKEVIDARECNLLVSAAAGSGKTAVLVERIIGRLLDEKDPASLDRMMVMTFTRAAAEGMRQKISEALGSHIRETEEKLKGLTAGSGEYVRTCERLEDLKSQETLLPRARISTIDSVCQTLIRQYFQYLDIDPAFRVADEAELRLMRSDLIRDLLEEKYEEGAEDFIRFSEAFTKNGLDERLSSLVLRTCEFAQAKPWPEDFLASCAAQARMEADGDLWDTEWFHGLLKRLDSKCGRILENITRTDECCKAPDGWKPYLELTGCLKETCGELKDVFERKKGRDAYEQARKILSEMSLPDLSRRKCDESSAEKKEEAKASIEEARDFLKGLAKDYFSMSAERVSLSAAGSAGDLLVLINLTLEFMTRFAEKKKDRSVVDFGDMEHLCLKLLYTERDGKREFSALADELARGLDEILIDEYQDSNEVQEELIRALSAERFGRPDVFMVGDVKQSIYSFRQAKPELFMEKYRAYGETGKNRKIELNRNFRSRPEVLDTVNDVFREIMKPSCGGILYDDAAALRPGRTDCLDKETGAVIPCASDRTELLLVEENAGEPENDPTPVYFGEDELEYVMIADRIRELTDPQTADPPRQKKDITVLMRNSKKAEQLVDVLAAFGIDACFDSATGYFASREISTVLAFLDIIDNPRQDIALVTVLKSAFAGFTDEELAKIRAGYGRREDGSAKEFYDALCAAAQEASQETKPAQETEDAGWDGLCEKCRLFLQSLEEYRSLAGTLPVHELIHRIYRETGYYDYTSALPGGKKRRRNLDMLLEKAENYSATSYHGLFNFTRYIEQLKNYETDYGEAAGISGTDDVVRITTIHKSKGLEYPVTIIAGMDGRFNLSDTRESLMLDEELGPACDYVDTKQRIRYPSLKAALIRERMRTEQAGEELRVLYVAMTRARDKLIMTGRISDYEKKKKEEAGKAGNIAQAVTQQQLLLRSGITEKESLLVHTYEKTALERMEPQKQADGEKTQDLKDLLCRSVSGIGEQTDAQELKDRLEASYAHEAETKLKPKVSVSELKAKLITETEFEFVRDLEENRQTKGAEYGTIVHRAFELLDYGKEEGEIPEMLPGADEKTMQAVRGVIAAFRETGLYADMKEAALSGRLYREQHFMIGLPAEELTPGSGSEELQLLQGIIDAYILAPEGIRLIDYKTDRVESEEKLVSRYALQLSLYARALEQLLRRPVTEKLIYSTCLGKTVRV